MNHEPHGRAGMSYHIGHKTLQKLCAAFGFDVEVLGSSTFEAHGERRAIYTCKRPNGTKTYRAIQYANGMIVAI